MSFSIGGDLMGMDAGVNVDFKKGIIPSVSAHLDKAKASKGSSHFRRTLTFKAENLEKDATLLLTFDNLIPGMYMDMFPVCCKVAMFGAGGTYMNTFTYENHLVFCKPQVDRSDNIVDAGTYVSIDDGQKTTLIKDDGGIYSFTNPQDDTGSTTIKAYNGTQQEENMAVGFFVSEDRRPTSVLYYPKVGVQSSAGASFAPILHAYIISQAEYREGQIIKGQVSSPVIFEQNLAKLDENTVWKVTFDQATDTFSIERV